MKAVLLLLVYAQNIVFEVIEVSKGLNRYCRYLKFGIVSITSEADKNNRLFPKSLG